MCSLRVRNNKIEAAMRCCNPQGKTDNPKAKRQPRYDSASRAAAYALGCFGIKLHEPKT